jgi:hypothetical protein
MSDLFGRKISLIVQAPGLPPVVQAAYDGSAGLEVSDFDIHFSIKRNLLSQPNTAEIQIYNLAPQSRTALASASGQNLTVSLSAGFQGGIEQLYLGEVRAAWTEHVGPDYITYFESGDGERVQKKRLLPIDTGLGGRVPISTALNAIVTALGIGPGNSALIQKSLAAQGVATLNASAVTGNATRRLTDLCRSAGLEWSIQNGVLQILEIGALLKGQAVLVSSDTGMLASPSVDSRGILHFKAEIIQGLVPGALVNVQSQFFQGGYRLERCHWHGQVDGPEWEVDCEGKKY